MTAGYVTLKEGRFPLRPEAPVTHSKIPRDALQVRDNVNAMTMHEEWLSTSAGHPGRPGDAASTPHAEGYKVGLEATDASLSHRFEDDRRKIAASFQLSRLHGVKQALALSSGPVRSRGDHSEAVSSIAGNLAGFLGLNVELAMAAGLGHDCGHAPGAHAGEEALDEIVPGGWSHASYGAVALAPLRLHALVKEGITQHSWCLPSPTTPESQVVALADRIEYATADLWDAEKVGINWHLSDSALELLGEDHSEWRPALIADAIETSQRVGYVALSERAMSALCEMRGTCSNSVYRNPDVLADSRRMKGAVISLMSTAMARGTMRALTYVCSLTDSEAQTAALELA